MYATTQTTLKALGLLLGVLLLGSCGVNGPDNSPWQSVADFSWPTTKGVIMKYRTIAGDSTRDNQVIVKLASASNASQPTPVYYNGQPMYELSDTTKESTANVRFLPMEDVLVVQQNRFGGDTALLAPLEKGHSWISNNDGKTYWTAEIIELFSYRKVEGIVYKNVVAVKYVKHWPQGRPKGSSEQEEEWIRFYAQGVGEIMTIRNVYPESTLSNPVPRQEERIVLIETTAAN